MNMLPTITDSAKKHLIKMAERSNATNIHFGVKGGGCAGFKYDWTTIETDKINPKDEVVKINEDKTLIIFENSLSFEISNLKEFKFNKIILVVNSNEFRQVKLSDNVIKFKSELINDQLKRIESLSINCEIVSVDKLKDIKSDFYILYPSVGENLDFVMSNLSNYKFIYRELDQFSWQFCNKGFFNFKTYIPKIIAKFT